MTAADQTLPAPQQAFHGYARVGVKGYIEHTGEVWEITRFGIQFVQVRRTDGRQVEFPPDSIHQIAWMGEDDYRRITAPRPALTAGQCICGPDGTGEAPECRPDCPVHGDGGDTNPYETEDPF